MPIEILYIGNKLSHHGLTPGVIETLGRHLEKSGYKVYYAGTKNCQVSRLVQMLYKTLTVGRRIDYILIDTYSTHAFWYAYLTGRLAKLIGTKYIPILHGGALPDRLVRSKCSCDKLFKNSYVNVAVSGYLKHEFEKQGYKAVVIPNSIDISLYPFKQREYPRAKLLWVRSFHKQYNPNMAADVLAELLKTYPDAELCMVGPDKDGSMQEFKQYSNNLGLSDKIKVTGLLSKDEWLRLSEEFDFFINTTNVDNTPVSVIEVLALGLPVVTTNVGGIPFLVDDGIDALLVEPEDPKAMSAAIVDLLTNPGFANRLSINGRSKAEQFDWKIIKEQWMRLLLS